MKYNRENREMLAEIVAGSMDGDAIYEALIELIEYNYEHDEDLFHRDVEEYDEEDNDE